MSRRVLRYYNRPKDLPDEVKVQIRNLFNEHIVAINYEAEFLIVGSIVVPMEAIGKMIGLMNNAGVTTRKK